MSDDVFCVMEKSVFEDAVQSGEFQPESLATEGFVHCTQLHQSVEVANIFYAIFPNVVLARIERARLRSKVLDEEAADERFQGRGDTYPHIYGPLNMDAVIDVQDMERDEAGQFLMPAQYESL